MVAGTRDDAVALREEGAQVLARAGLRLPEEKTLIKHIDEGLDFLGWRIHRHRKRGTDQHYVYTYPSRKALRAAMAKVKTWCRQVANQPLDVLPARLNPLPQGWTAFSRPRVSSKTFQCLSAYVWRRVAPPTRALDAGLRPGPFPGQAASLLPGLLAATRAGLPPASDDELTNTKIHRGLRHGLTSHSAGRTEDRG
jgi:hypothetical protein